jgi:hypothetical protein
MPRVDELKQAFKDTRLNLVVAFEDPLHADPSACQWVVWHLRVKKDPALTLEQVTEFSHEELLEAVRDFFQRPSPQSAVSTTGSPESTSASAGSDGVSPTSTEQT